MLERYVSAVAAGIKRRKSSNFDLLWICCRLQQAVQWIHSISTCRDVQQIESIQRVHNNPQQIEYVEFSARLAVDLLYRSNQSRKRVYMTSYYVKWQQVTHEAVVRAVALATTQVFHYYPHSVFASIGLRLCFVASASTTKVIKVVADTADISAKRTSSSSVSDILPQLINYLFRSSQLLPLPSRLANPQPVHNKSNKWSLS